MFGLVTCLGLLSLLAWGTWRRPAVAFAAVLCLYGLKQWGQNTSPFLIQNRTFVNLAVGVLVIAGLALSRLRGYSTWKLSTPGALGLALFAYAAVTLVWTPLLPAALNQWSLQFPYVVTIAILAPLLFKSADDVLTAAGWTVLTGGAICLLALFAGTWGARGLLVAGDPYGMETNPLAIASLGGSILIMALMAISTPQPRLIKALYVALALAGLAVILRSGSRGQLAAALLATLLGLHLISKRRNAGTLLAVGIAGAILAAIAWWLWTQLGVDSDRWSGEQSADDLTGRLQLAMILLGEAASNPATLLFGIGNSGAFYYIGGYPHVAALEVIAEEGLIGAGLYVAVFVTAIQAIRRLMHTSRLNDDETLRHATALLTALLAFEWVLTLKQGTLLSSTYFIAYAAVLGRMQMWSAEQPAVARNEATPRPRVRFANLMR